MLDTGSWMLDEKMNPFFLVIVHRRDAKGAEDYLLLLSGERPESNKT
jgi:hypothetical protein